MSQLSRSLIFSLSSAIVVINVGCSNDDAPSEVAKDTGAATDEGPSDTSNDVAATEAGIDADSGVASDGSLVAARPYGTKIPSGYDKTKATPLVILLHGYGASGAIQESYFGLGAVADEKTFLLAMPDGTVDSSGKRFWDATDACCNFGTTKVDDVAYVAAIIDDMSAKYNVDPKRVYLVGHSNGGFMSHRAACDLSPRIAAIVSLAGAQWKDAAKCAPTSPVSILQVHGDADETIAYEGGSFAAGGPAYPGAKETVAHWAALEGCSATLSPTAIKHDLDSKLAGDETRVERHAGCTAGAVELWTIEGGGHIPNLTARWAGLVYDFLSAHPKP